MSTDDPRPGLPVDPTELAHTPLPEDAIAAPATSARLVAEAAGTFLLVFGGVGTALVAANNGLAANGFPVGVGYVGVALAFGLTVVAGAYAWGPISGGHFNPAVTLGLAAAGRFPWRDTIGYIVAQVVGGALATSVIVLVILGVTHATRGTPALAGLAIGLTLTLIHLVSIPIDNTSVNPARSIAAAIYGGTDALAQLWVFLVFPIVGALVAGFAHRALFERAAL